MSLLAMSSCVSRRSKNGEKWRSKLGLSKRLLRKKTENLKRRREGKMRNERRLKEKQMRQEGKRTNRNLLR
jgi:hypothetical protein